MNTYKRREQGAGNKETRKMRVVGKTAHFKKKDLLRFGDLLEKHGVIVTIPRLEPWVPPAPC